MLSQDTSARLRFEKYVRRTEDCWVWTGYRSAAGYGHFRVGQVQKGAHCWAWEWANGCPIPPGMQIHHTCRNPGCVNPDHLELSTRTRNLQQRRYDLWTDVTARIEAEPPLTVTLTPEHSAWVRARANAVRTSAEDVVERALHSYMATWRWNQSQRKTSD